MATGPDDDSTAKADSIKLSPEKLRGIFDKYRDFGNRKPISSRLTDMSGSMSSGMDILSHEMPHYPIDKYPVKKNISKIFEEKILRIDASDYTSKIFDKKLDNLLGPPKGYQGFKIKMTPEQQQALNEALAATRIYLDQRQSQDNGDALAAACHDGIAAPTGAMRPLRFRGATSAGFSMARTSWS